MPRLRRIPLAERHGTLLSRMTPRLVGIEQQFLQRGLEREPVRAAVRAVVWLRVDGLIDALAFSLISLAGPRLHGSVERRLWRARNLCPARRRGDDREQDDRPRLATTAAAHASAAASMTPRPCHDQITALGKNARATEPKQADAPRDKSCHDETSGHRGHLFAKSAYSTLTENRLLKDSPAYGTSATIFGMMSGSWSGSGAACSDLLVRTGYCSPSASSMSGSRPRSRQPRQRSRIANPVSTGGASARVRSRSGPRSSGVESTSRSGSGPRDSCPQDAAGMRRVFRGYEPSARGQ